MVGSSPQYIEACSLQGESQMAKSGYEKRNLLRHRLIASDGAEAKCDGRLFQKKIVTL